MKEVLKHGSLEKCVAYDEEHSGILYFRCERCGCEFKASIKDKEIMTSQYEGDSSICPECGFQTYECYSYKHELEGSRKDENTTHPKLFSGGPRFA